MVFKIEAIKKEDPIVIELGYPTEEDEDNTAIFVIKFIQDWPEEQLTRWLNQYQRIQREQSLIKAGKKTKETEFFSSDIYKDVYKNILNSEGQYVWRVLTLKEKEAIVAGFAKEIERRIKETEKKGKKGQK